MSKFSGMGLSVDAPVRMTLTNPAKGQPLTTADGEPCYIDLYSLDSERAQKFDRLQANRRLASNTRIKLKSEDLEEERNARLATVTAGWQLAGLNGEPVEVECDFATAKELYADPSMAWVRDQVMDFLGDRANFAPASSKT